MTREDWAYFSTIKDLYDGFIVAHVFDRNNSIALVSNTVRQAKQKEKVTGRLIPHGDQGHQYISQAYRCILANECNITPSMSRRGNCWDNASTENCFGHLKEEYLSHFKNPIFEGAQQIIDEYIYFYNYKRIQLKTRQTPFERRCLSF
jgi:putative transposase